MKPTSAIKSNNPENPNDVILVVYLLEKSDGHYMRKGMSEEEGPFVYDCPAHLVAMVPEPEHAPKHDANDPWNAKIIYGSNSIIPEHGDTWRAQWRKYQARDAKIAAKKANIVVGDELTLTNGWQVKVTSLRPLLATDANGKTWKVPKRFLTA